jgi:mannosylglucosylglycerate synthase
MANVERHLQAATAVGLATQPDKERRSPVVKGAHFVFNESDGVSLQDRENTGVLKELGMTVTQCSSDAEGEGAFVIPLLDLKRPDVKGLKNRIYTKQDLGSDEEASLNRELQDQVDEIRDGLEEMLETQDPSTIHVRNILSLPIHPAATVAFAEFIRDHQEVNFVLQHHDMVNEIRKPAYSTPYDSLRERIFGSLFPPAENVRHAVINSRDQAVLQEERGINAEIIFDSFDFDTQPKVSDVDIRERFRIGENDFLLMQPGRIIPRKRIEDAIDYGADYVNFIQRRMQSEGMDEMTLGQRTYNDKSKCVLLLPQSRDKDEAYFEMLKEHAERRGVTIAYIGDSVVTDEKYDKEARIEGKIPFYSLYANDEIDRVIIPSEEEGFGNNLLEAMALAPLRENPKLPVVHEYPVFGLDIKPVLPEEGFISLGGPNDYRIINPETGLKELPESIRMRAVLHTFENDQQPEVEKSKTNEVYDAMKDAFDAHSVTSQSLAPLLAA